MKHYDADSYFAIRAPRYQSALMALPAARTLDLLPYCAVISLLNPNGARRLRVADAFGGTGFLARGLAWAGLEFVVCDCCDEMLSGAVGLPNVDLHETRDDFQSVLSAYGKGQFDLVFSHGGMHHVVDMNGKPNETSSRERQAQVAKRLAELVRPGGALIIADIAEGEPSEVRGKIHNAMIGSVSLERMIGAEAVKFVTPLLDLGSERSISLDALRRKVENRIVAPVTFSVPRRFFDQYVACKTRLGHVAVYVDFDAVDRLITAEGLESLGRINYRGPWLFGNESEAGWFFKEKFCVGEPKPLGSDLQADMDMFEVLRTYLGTSSRRGYVGVNWGVTYATYMRPLR
jgi:SAM-dependent methyltransferase